MAASCDRVAWIDCDVVFGDDDWPQAANAALDRHPVIQPFDTSCELLRDAGPAGIDVAHAYLTCRSLACGLACGDVKPDIMLSPDKRGLGAGIDQRPVHEIAAGVVGNFQDFIDYLQLNPRRREHFLAWARPFHDAVRADLGHCPGTIFHLWHGDLVDRHYRERRIGFAAFDFDPSSDIAADPAGAWRWSSDKPAMHRFVRAYFESRLEDGRPDAIALDQAGGAGR